MLAGIIPMRPDRQYILCYQALYIWWLFTSMLPDIVMAGIERNSKIDLIFMFPLAFFYCNMLRYDRAEIKQNKPCPYFMCDIFTLLGMEVSSTNDMF